MGTFPRRQHYIEYLAGLVRKGKLDPADIFDLNEAKQELRRRGKVPPAKDQKMSDQDYLTVCIQVTNICSAWFVNPARYFQQNELVRIFSTHESFYISQIYNFKAIFYLYLLLVYLCQHMWWPIRNNFISSDLKSQNKTQ